MRLTYSSYLLMKGFQTVKAILPDRAAGLGVAVAAGLGVLLGAGVDVGPLGVLTAVRVGVAVLPDVVVAVAVVLKTMGVQVGVGDSPLPPGVAPVPGMTRTCPDRIKAGLVMLLA